MLPILSLIPDPLKIEIADTLVDFLVKQAEKFTSDQIASKIRGWSSKAEFQQSLDKAVHAGIERFGEEYRLRDEDLAEALLADQAFWLSPNVQHELFALIRRPGTWLVDEREKLDRHFEDILPKRINRERVDRAVTFLLRCVVEELWTLPGAKEIREVYSLQFQKVTAEAARQQVALAQQQIQATTQLSTDLRQALAQLTAAMEKNLLAAPSVASPPHPRPYHNLPRPDYSRFVGRETELSWLRQRLSPQDRAWQIAITGIGGVGKSALALAIAHEYCQGYDQLPPEERFEAIIWVSAKEEVLTAEGKQQAALPELVLRTLEDVYSAIARALDREDITRALPEDQGHIVEKALKEQRTLLVMDNLESVKDERIKPFLRNLPAPTKTIITSREWLDVADVWTLKGLTFGDAEKLIIEEAAIRNVCLDDAYCHRIYDLTSGLPLPIKLSIARLAGGESFPSVDRWLGNATGDLPEYCITGQAELAKRRDPNAWKLLLACSLFDRSTGSSRDALGYVSDLSIADRDNGLSLLQRLFLVNRNENDRFWVLPIIQRYASVKLVSTELGEPISHQWVHWLVKFAHKYGSDIDLEIEPRQEFDLEYPNILNAIWWCYDQGKWETLLDLADHTLAYAFFKSLFHDFKQILDAAHNAVQITKNERMMGKIEFQFGRLGWMQSRSKSFVKEHIDRANDIFRQYTHEIDNPETLATLISLYIYQNRHQEAKPYARYLLKLGEDTANLQLKYVAAYRFAELEANGGNVGQALTWLDKAESWARELMGSRNIAAVLFRRGVLLLRQGEIQRAEALLLETLEMDITRGEKRRVAYDKNILAKIFLQTGRNDLARQAAQEASEIYKSLEMTEDRMEADALLEEINNEVELS